MIAAPLVLLLGWVVHGAVGRGAAQVIWMVGLILCAGPIALRTLRDSLQKRFATDIVAALAIVGAILLQLPIAGLVVVVMLEGGGALERYAEGRASQAVRLLEEATPRLAHRMVATGTSDVDAAEVAVGDVILVRPGELIPCDGIVVGGASDVDTSALTGEPLPLAAREGTRVSSGGLNGAGILQIRTTARAVESQYARIVDLVRTAQSHKAPLQRMADRYAAWFTPVTLGVCALAFAAARDWTRVLAVLVVATPCPLILATPIAFVGGINRAARRNIIIRNGGALERLSRVTTVLLDKTGTITLGEPQLASVRTANGLTADEILRLAASVEHGSSHRIARTVARAAGDRGLVLAPVADFHESAGQGVQAIVEGHSVHLGARGYVLPNAAVSPSTLERLESGPALLRTYVAVDGQLSAILEYDEELRADTRSMIEDLQRMGMRHIALLSGDRVANVRAMASRAGIADVRGDLLPGDKAAIVERLRRSGEVVMMVGDGTNDAPALAAADVGVALAGHGGGVTAEAADVILLRDSLKSAAEALAIGRRSTRIARESIFIGLGLSATAMVWAAFGGLSPVAGALLQEAIDVAVIVNALRTLKGFSDKIAPDR
jgi:heavy metal translocating P-type ATPase